MDATTIIQGKEAATSLLAPRLAEIISHAFPPVALLCDLDGSVHFTTLADIAKHFHCTDRRIHTRGGGSTPAEEGRVAHRLFNHSHCAIYNNVGSHDTRAGFTLCLP